MHLFGRFSSLCPLSLCHTQLFTRIQRHFALVLCRHNIYDMHATLLIFLFIANTHTRARDTVCKGMNKTRILLLDKAQGVVGCVVLFLGRFIQNGGWVCWMQANL